MKPALSTSPNDRGHLFVPRRFHRLTFLVWLRHTHAWLGIWGAALGLLFGISGFLLNHRATLKIPAAQNAETQLQVELRGTPPESPAALGEFLRRELDLNAQPTRPRKEPTKRVPWGNGEIKQPERWQVNFVTLGETVQAEYWVGNRYVSVKRSDPNFFALLTRLHQGTGAGIGWVLLVDTLAGALVVLSLTGLLLWTRLHGPRLLALGLVGACATLAVVFATSGW